MSAGLLGRDDCPFDSGEDLPLQTAITTDGCPVVARRDGGRSLAVDRRIGGAIIATLVSKHRPFGRIEPLDLDQASQHDVGTGGDQAKLSDGLLAPVRSAEDAAAGRC